MPLGRLLGNSLWFEIINESVEVHIRLDSIEVSTPLCGSGNPSSILGLVIFLLPQNRFQLARYHGKSMLIAGE